ncbi:zf-TFIIB domain-containing protein [Sporolactobacillus laevolacticus]|uniref:TFIIB-type zinc ribbon-containing protein n=1 Tax=Sporolactobacillus laevolacticus TaxID=33018 RepID=UPI0025B615F0|nr:zf-TFIIB domain-containing protein [Sporolactobacillus laevolacticus]MDN3955757.1 zf-TFIIB domain-containing protein [Sporolactobacillus laevolacticus]
MFCPVCEDVRMKEVERDGVLIDICPSCKGVWLDRGELDKISSRVKEVRRPFNDWYEREDDDRKRYNDRDYKEDSYYDKERDRNYYPRKKKKKSVMDMLGDMFD